MHLSCISNVSTNRIGHPFHEYARCNVQNFTHYTDFKPFQYISVNIVDLILQMTSYKEKSNGHQYYK